MLTAPLPEALADALAATLGSDDRSAASSSLSDRYREAAPGSPVARSRDETLAYAAARLPATYASARSVFAEVAARAPGLAPRTQLDLGSGPGTALWAARATWPSIERWTAVEAEPEMRRLALELGGFMLTTGLIPGAIHGGPYDLVSAAYLLGELPPHAIEETVERAWAATAGALVIVEPGTPAGFARVLAARDRLIGLGGAVVAPCPHDAACPLAAIPGEWCHFAVRVARSRAHRAAKQAQLGHEDEKFAYVAVTRGAGDAAAARVLRHPQLRPGQVVVELCATDGLRTEIVSKRQGERYRRARKLDWGAAFDEPVTSGASPTSTS
jgi:ribosomal protein RSM22 (predicted rRNA methylase)